MALKSSAFIIKQWSQIREMGMSKVCFCLKILNVCVFERTNSIYRTGNWIRWSTVHTSQDGDIHLGVISIWSVLVDIPQERELKKKRR